MIKRLVLALALILGCAQAGATEQPCTQTFNNTTGLVTAVTNAANGDVICLTSGNSFGSVSFSNITGRTGYVTVRSTTGQGATIAPQVSNSQYLRFLNLTFSGSITLDNCVKNVQFVNSAFSGGTAGMGIDETSCQGVAHNILVDGVNFTNTSSILREGRLSVLYLRDSIIRNSTFAGHATGGGDGIYVNDAGNLTIGPGNYFNDIVQTPCQSDPGVPHCDPIQMVGSDGVTITGNFFYNNETGVMLGGGSTNYTIEHNVFNSINNYPYQQNLWTCSAAVITDRHNTMVDGYIRSEFDSCGTSTANVSVYDNVVSDTLTTAGGTSWSAATVHHNVFGSSPGVGTNEIIGTATFTGGSDPTTWAGHKLTSGSVGFGNASDSKNRGSNYFNPPAPANIR